MLVRITEEEFYIGYYTEEFMSENNDPDWIIIDVSELPENLVKPKWDSEKWIEGETNSEKEYRIKIETERINKEYTIKISELVAKHIERLNFDGIEIPEEIKEKRQFLRDECNSKIEKLK